MESLIEDLECGLANVRYLLSADWGSETLKKYLEDTASLLGHAIGEAHHWQAVLAFEGNSVME